MQEAKKISVENRPQARAPRGSERRSVATWQSLLLVILILLHWQIQYQFRVSMHYDVNAWQEKRGFETKRSDKREKPSDIKVSMSAGHGNVHSIGQNINQKRKQEIDAMMYVVHNMQNGKRCETRHGQRCTQFKSEPRWVSKMKLYRFEGYWLGGLCMRELITLDCAKKQTTICSKGRKIARFKGAMRRSSFQSQKIKKRK